MIVRVSGSRLQSQVKGRHQMMLVMVSIGQLRGDWSSRLKSCSDGLVVVLLLILMSIVC